MSTSFGELEGVFSTMWGREADADWEGTYKPLANISSAHLLRTAVAPGPQRGCGTDTCFQSGLKLSVTGG